MIYKEYMAVRIFWKAKSIKNITIAKITDATMTTIAELCSFCHVGHVTFWVNSL